jgi:hypothetical protein
MLALHVSFHQQLCLARDVGGLGTRLHCHEAGHVDEIEKQHVRARDVEDDDSGGAHSFQCSVLFLDNPPHFLAHVGSATLCCDDVGSTIRGACCEVEHLQFGGRARSERRRCTWIGRRVFQRECCLLVLNLVSSTLSCIRQPRQRLSRVLSARQQGRHHQAI